MASRPSPAERLPMSSLADWVWASPGTEWVSASRRRSLRSVQVSSSVELSSFSHPQALLEMSMEFHPTAESEN